MQQFRYAALAIVLAVSACAHAVPAAPLPMPTKETEPPELTAVSAAVAIVEVTPADAAVPAGIDVTAFELPVQYNEHVQHYVDRYARRHRSTFATRLGRMERYRGHIEQQLRDLGLPRELIYLPLIESAYQTSAASHASAVGLWQFMKGTARAEGLEISEYIDERRDPVRSTEAALRHLQRLYHQFDSWYLAAAAYNSGSTRIARLLREGGHTTGSDSVFWTLRDLLPAETRDYVPMLLAAAIVGENTIQFGITVDPEPAFRFDVATVPGATELHAVARAAGTTLDAIKALNPHYIKGSTPPGRAVDVRVPVGAAAGFAAAFEKIPAAERTRPLTRTHVVKTGETLSGLANRYGTTLEILTRLNQIEFPDALRVGTRLLIPFGTR